MVAFFKATEVHLRSIRSTSGGGKRGNPGRSKGAKSQEALRVANVAGKRSRRPGFNLVHACKINETPPGADRVNSRMPPVLLRFLPRQNTKSRLWLQQKFRETGLCLCEVLKH